MTGKLINTFQARIMLVSSRGGIKQHWQKRLGDGEEGSTDGRPGVWSEGGKICPEAEAGRMLPSVCLPLLSGGTGDPGGDQLQFRSGDASLRRRS